MKTSDFLELVQIYRLASLDMGSPTLTLAPDGAGVTASFEGIHVGAMRRGAVEIEDLHEEISVRWETLNGALALMDNESPLQAQVAVTDLMFRSGTRRAQIRLATEHSTFRWDETHTADAPGFTLDLDDLRRVLPLLAGVTARTIERPVLTGIHIACVGDSIVCRATDGVRGVAARVSGEGDQLDFTIQAADLTTILEVLGHPDAPVRFARRPGENAVMVQTDNTVIRVSALVGEFPTFTRLMQGKFPHVIDLSTEVIRLAHRAASVMDSDNTVQLHAREGVLRVIVAGNELGSFAMEVGPAADDLDIAFTADHLGLAAELGVDEVKVHFSDISSPAMITEASGGIRYWLSPTKGGV